MYQIKSIGLVLAQLFSGFCLAYVLAFVGKGFVSYGTFSFVFILLSITTAFFFLLRKYSVLALLIVDSSLLFLAILLRLYAQS